MVGCSSIAAKGGSDSAAAAKTKKVGQPSQRSQKAAVGNRHHRRTVASEGLQRLGSSDVNDSDSQQTSDVDSDGVPARMGWQSVQVALQSLAKGKMVIVLDEETREKEGDLIMAAQFATPTQIAYMIRHTSGILCAPMDGAIADRLELPPMVANNSDPRQTPFTVSVDLRDGSTGISPAARARTFSRLADPAAFAGDFQRPGHVFPLRAQPAGLFARRGHTEAAVDLCRLAGLTPVAILAELSSSYNNNEMAGPDESQLFASSHDLDMTTIEDVLRFRKRCGDLPSLSGTDLQSARRSHKRIYLLLLTTLLAVLPLLLFYTGAQSSSIINRFFQLPDIASNPNATASADQ